MMRSKTRKAPVETEIARRKTVPVLRRLAGPASSPSARGFLCRIPRAAARLALAAMLLAGAGAVAVPASAEVLVSNLGRSDSGAASLADHDQAQAFTTGSDEGGYTLTSVEIEFDKVAAGAAITVSIWTDSSGSPGTSLGTLTNPTLTATDSGARDRANDIVYEFTTEGIDLAKDTRYFVVVDSTTDASATEIQDTGSDFEDSSGATGWSLANGSLHRDWNTTGSWTPSDDTKKILINGIVKSRPFPQGTLRLQGGSIYRVEGRQETFHNGRLEVFYNGQWGGVCRRSFSARDAKVACRQLGYTGGRDISTRFPAPSGMPIWLDYVECTGSESRLDRCPHAGWGPQNCAARNASSVLCHTEDDIVDGANPDNRGPELVSMVAKFTKITLTFDEELDETSNPGIYSGGGIRINGVSVGGWQSGFRVTLGKGKTSWVGFINDVAISGKQVVITMADSHTVRHNLFVRVSYRKGGPVRLQDKQGNEVTSWRAPSSYNIWGFGWHWKSATNITPNPAVVLDKTTLTVEEGDETGGTYTVKLAEAPPAGETYYIRLFADTVIRKRYRYSRVRPSPRVLAFTSDNWNTGVIVTVTGYEYEGDDDGKSNTARIWHQEKSEGRIVTVTVTEPLNPSPQTAAPGAPTVDATPGDGAVTLTWTAPEYDGTITGWEVRYGAAASPGRLGRLDGRRGCDGGDGVAHRDGSGERHRLCVPGAGDGGRGRGNGVEYGGLDAQGAERAGLAGAGRPHARPGLRRRHGGLHGGRGGGHGADHGDGNGGLRVVRSRRVAGRRRRRCRRPPGGARRGGDRSDGHGDAGRRRRGEDVHGDGDAGGGGGASGRGDAGAGGLEPDPRGRRAGRTLPAAHPDLDKAQRGGEGHRRLQPARAHGGRRGPRRHPGPRRGVRRARVHPRRRCADQHRHRLDRREPGRAGLVAGRREGRGRLCGPLRRALGEHRAARRERRGDFVPEGVHGLPERRQHRRRAGPALGRHRPAGHEWRGAQQQRLAHAAHHAAAALRPLAGVRGRAGACGACGGGASRRRRGDADLDGAGI